jgi:hypothetical protein
VIAMAEAMRDGWLPGVRGLRDASGSRLPGALSGAARRLRIRHALVTSASPEGPCCVLVLRAPAEDQ